MLLTPIDPERDRIDIDLRYATADNITGAPIYRRPLCLLHPDAAAALRRAAAIAAGIGLRLTIWDAFRPIEAQWALWRALPDPRWVADPRRGSNHNRGVAVDLTLSGRAMGTGFDEAVPQSAHGATGVAEEAQRNRLLLAGIMAAAGWELDAFEWWHYQLPAASGYPLLSDGALGPLAMM
jgi:D-alanyl-D-alanine dipeptidase